MRCLLAPGRLGLALLLVGTVVLAGCSRPSGSVSGKVSYNGKLLKGGSVAFVSADRPSVSGSINEDGTYSIPQLTAGEYKICVDTSMLKAAGSGPAPGVFTGPGGPKGAPTKGGGADGKSVVIPTDPTGAAQNAKKYVQIPEKYRDASTTDLTYSFAGGSQIHDIDLK